MERRKLVFPVLLAVYVAGLILFAAFRTDIAITYHQRRMERAWRELNATRPGDPKQPRLIEAFEHHEAALVELGFFERKEFLLRHISVPSLQSRRLWEELAGAFPEYANVTMEGYGTHEPDVIIVCDRPENLTRWEEIIRAHDQPLAGPPGQATIEDGSALQPWIGRWADDDGNVLVSITLEPDGTATIKVPSADPWETIVKNVRFDGGRLRFDEYHYTEPRDEYKSVTNSSGEHPFSGVRCEVLLEIDPASADRMEYRVNTPVLGEAKKAMLRRVER